jgi:tetratricopeptide (TPR) repeat protein
MLNKSKLMSALKCLAVGFVVSLMFSACGANLHQQAEMYLNHQQNEAALKIYLGLMKSSKKPDINAMIGAAIAYRNLEQRKPCIKICRQILKHEPKNAAAMYYLGSSLEEMGMEHLAMKFYRQYQEVSPNDPYYSFLKARMNIVKMRNKDIN